MRKYIRVIIVFSVVLAVAGAWASAGMAQADDEGASSTLAEAPETIWQIGTFDGEKTEFFEDLKDEDFVCDATVPGGSGQAGSFIVGQTATDLFPAEIRSSDAPQDDCRYRHSCNSVTIEFTIPSGSGYKNAVLRYSRMGGEKDAVYFDDTLVGYANLVTSDPTPSKDYFFKIHGIRPGTHTIRIVGQERTACGNGGTCQDGMVDGYHYVDALRLTGEIVSVVEIDIRPFTNQNQVNPRSHGVIPVAILSSDHFDAATADIATLWRRWWHW